MICKRHALKRYFLVSYCDSESEGDKQVRRNGDPRASTVGHRGNTWGDPRRDGQNRENTLCCGGGGDLEMVDSDLVSAVAARKIEMALKAEMIVTACPQCERTMSAAVRAHKKRVRVLDVTEMVWRVMERGEEGIES